MGLNGKMVTFSGHKMPIWYTTIKEEHLAVRSNAGLFDISHMGLFVVSGEQAFKTLQHLSCNSLKRVKDGFMVYTMFLNETGTILDDVMIGPYGDDYIVIVNAGNTVKIKSWILANKDSGVQLTILNESYCFLAIQGPKALVRLESCLEIPLTTTKRFSMSAMMIKNASCHVLRTGYTGEEGVEIIVPHDRSEEIWEACINGGITPCGLGARDSLRLEAGLPLYGQELSEEITPFMTRYRWVVQFDHDFIGKEALVGQADSDPDLVTVGFKMKEPNAIARTHYKIKEGGYVTSGTLSPSLNSPIGMAFIPKAYSEIGTTFDVSIRGKFCKAEVVKVPFV